MENDLICLSPTRQTNPMPKKDSLKRPHDLIETELKDRSPPRCDETMESPTNGAKAVDPPEDEPEYVESDDEDDAYRLTVNPERPRMITEKKRLDTAAFQSWITKNQREVTKNSAQAAQDLVHQSVAYLVKENEDKKIIGTPREYQTELLERAKTKNTIVVLDTGMSLPPDFCVSDISRFWQNTHRGASSEAHSGPRAGRSCRWKTQESLLLLG